jgi:hypothetical protein
MAINTDPANLNRIRALSRRQRHHLVSGGADCAPPGVGILLAWICAATGCAACNGNRRTTLRIEEECFDRGAPKVKGEKRGANRSTHQVRRR